MGWCLASGRRSTESRRVASRALASRAGLDLGRDLGGRFAPDPVTPDDARSSDAKRLKGRHKGPCPWALGMAVGRTGSDQPSALRWTRCKIISQRFSRSRFHHKNNTYSSHTHHTTYIDYHSTRRSFNTMPSPLRRASRPSTSLSRIGYSPSKPPCHTFRGARRQRPARPSRGAAARTRGQSRGSLGGPSPAPPRAPRARAGRAARPPRHAQRQGSSSRGCGHLRGSPGGRARATPRSRRVPSRTAARPPPADRSRRGGSPGRYGSNT